MKQIKHVNDEFYFILFEILKGIFHVFIINNYNYYNYNYNYKGDFSFIFKQLDIFSKLCTLLQEPCHGKVVVFNNEDKKSWKGGTYFGFLFSLRTNGGVWVSKQKGNYNI